MHIGDLVRHKRLDRLFIIFQIAENGNIGLWSPRGLRDRPMKPGSLLWVGESTLVVIQ